MWRRKKAAEKKKEASREAAPAHLPPPDPAVPAEAQLPSVVTDPALAAEKLPTPPLTPQTPANPAPPTPSNLLESLPLPVPLPLPVQKETKEKPLADDWLICKLSERQMAEDLFDGIEGGIPLIPLSSISSVAPRRKSAPPKALGMTLSVGGDDESEDGLEYFVSKIKTERDDIVSVSDRRWTVTPGEEGTLLGHKLKTHVLRDTRENRQLSSDIVTRVMTDLNRIKRMSEISVRTGITVMDGSYQGGADHHAQRHSRDNTADFFTSPLAKNMGDSQLSRSTPYGPSEPLLSSPSAQSKVRKSLDGRVAVDDEGEGGETEQVLNRMESRVA
ncbi:unnamed protein product [Vitrella brassicaformis CCMP3155]|uniref:Uncharacterized protein n=1 Tax=Vitrella brassicaformis (strain CCMP3155) TaxID=1169540 RepID=A0A0G4GYB6_VITBC|nr:unnamed protein product [Vitrella brassicaformis CCMP3155]|eukprot:CEM36128.1 unnamed protein product [Vitrella brassicaformis CCMP3155]